MAAPRAVRAGSVACAALGLGLTGCGGSGGPPDRIGGHRLTIYLSLPFDGPPGRRAGRARRRRAGAVGAAGRAPRALPHPAAGARRRHPGRRGVGSRPDDRGRPARGRRPDRDRLPRRPQLRRQRRVDPAARTGGHPPDQPRRAPGVGLTDSGAGADPGEPQKYYPTGVRTFVRVPPSDAVQAAVQVELQRQQGCRSTFVLDDGEVDGEDIATSFGAGGPGGGAAGGRDPGVSGRGHRLQLARRKRRRRPSRLRADRGDRSAGRGAAHRAAGCGAAPSPPVRHCRARGARLRRPGRRRPPARRSTAALLLTSPGAGPVAPAAGGPGVRRRVHAAATAHAPPVAIFGYEAMSLLLDAIGRSSDGGREARAPLAGPRRGVRHPGARQRPGHLQHHPERRQHACAATASIASAAADWPSGRC